MGVRRIETAAVMLPVAAAAAFVAYTLISGVREHSASEAAAKTAGFESAADQSLAGASGVSNSVEWKAKVAERAAQAKRDASDTEIRRENMKNAEIEGAARLAELNRPPGDRVTLTAQSWKTGGFETIGLMSFTVNNGNDYQIKDITITCTFNGNSGTYLGSRSHTLFEIVKANSKRSFAAVNIGFIPAQSARGGCGVQSAVRG